MTNIISFKPREEAEEDIPIYGACSGCGTDSWLAHMDDEDGSVVALECGGCRGVVELEPSIIITCELE
jgi:hypothetical protein